METLPWWKSAILRQQIVQLLVATTALVGINTDTIDLDATVASIFAGIAGVIALWTFITRLLKPSPPITATAVREEIRQVAAGTIPASPTGPQRGFFRPGAAVLALVLATLAAFAVTALSGCSVNPHKTAQTVEQHGDAAFGELTILKEQGSRILQNASVPDNVKRPIAEGIVAAKPVTDGLQDSLILYAKVKADVAVGASTPEKLAIVDRELAGWIAQAQPLISRLTAALAGAR